MLLVLAAIVWTTGCPGPEPTPQDGGADDAAMVDAARIDAAMSDGGGDVPIDADTPVDAPFDGGCEGGPCGLRELGAACDAHAQCLSSFCENDVCATAPGIPLVLLSDTDHTTGHDAGIVLLADRLRFEQRGGMYGGVRSDTAIAPGSGVFYFEAKRLITRTGAWGFGIATASAPLDAIPGANGQSAGLATAGQIQAEGGGSCTGPLWFPSDDEVYGFVVDYRGTNPILHVVLDVFGTLEVRRSCTLAVTAPVHAIYGGWRHDVPAMGAFNFGNDTTNHPFFYTRAQLETALTAASLGDVASALVMGFGRERWLPQSEAPVVDVDATASVALGASITLSASATDAEDGDLTAGIHWHDRSATYFPPTEHDGATWAYTPAELGRHSVDVTVTDSAGLTTTRTLVLTVTGTLPQSNPVRLVPDAIAGGQVTLSSDGLSISFHGPGKYGIRANQPIYGQFWYFEVTRLVGPVNMGFGLVTGTGVLDPYDSGDVPWSMSVNTTGAVWRELVWQHDVDPSNTTYGFAVDYRGESPIVYVIAGGARVSTLDMREVTVPLHPMLYGNPTGSTPPAYDQRANFGATAFVYDPVAILAAEGVTGLELGWGDANTP
ncbi:Ig-like domain-containing protein [Sandaracinus amylolyticus]|uniref:Ig-like domain-containing protein n=1 Tax=Sandaracinus amylolyticus TaxID=927083 RepID=UPI001F15E392|nr:hypothetical protein [Sandaracinus amylolyticus]